MGWRLDDDLQQMLRDSARGHLGEVGGAAHVRAVRASPDGFDAGAWARMGELGWTGILLPESHGGTGLGQEPALTLAEELGRAISPEPFVASCVMAATVLAASAAPASVALAHELASGCRSVTLAWQEQRGTLGVPEFAARLSQGVLNGNKVHVPGWHPDVALIVAAGGEHGPVIVRIDPVAPGLSVSPRRLTDGTFCADILFDGVAVADDAILLSGEAARDALAVAVARGTVALSAKLEGLAAELWRMTADYMRQRSQFGSHLIDFQALRHRMVDLYAEIELAGASWRAAAAAVGAGDYSGVAVHAAKARCSQIAQDMGRWAIQYHGAFGFTEEADVGLYVHAGLCWSSWLGNPSAHRRAALAAHRSRR